MYGDIFEFWGDCEELGNINMDNLKTTKNVPTSETLYIVTLDKRGWLREENSKGKIIPALRLEAINENGENVRVITFNRSPYIMKDKTIVAAACQKRDNKIVILANSMIFDIPNISVQEAQKELALSRIDQPVFPCATIETIMEMPVSERVSITAVIAHVSDLRTKKGKNKPLKRVRELTLTKNESYIKAVLFDQAADLTYGAGEVIELQDVLIVDDEYQGQVTRSLQTSWLDSIIVTEGDDQPNDTLLKAFELNVPDKPTDAIMFMSRGGMLFQVFVTKQILRDLFNCQPSALKAKMYSFVNRNLMCQMRSGRIVKMHHMTGCCESDVGESVSQPSTSSQHDNSKEVQEEDVQMSEEDDVEDSESTTSVVLPVVPTPKPTRPERKATKNPKKKVKTPALVDFTSDEEEDQEAPGPSKRPVRKAVLESPAIAISSNSDVIQKMDSDTDYHPSAEPSVTTSTATGISTLTEATEISIPPPRKGKKSTAAAGNTRKRKATIAALTESRPSEEEFIVEEKVPKKRGRKPKH